MGANLVSKLYACHVINWNINFVWQFQVADIIFISSASLENNFLYIYLCCFSPKGHNQVFGDLWLTAPFLDIAWVNATYPTKKPSWFQWLDSWGVWKTQKRFSIKRWHLTRFWPALISIKCSYKMNWLFLSTSPLEDKGGCLTKVWVTLTSLPKYCHIAYNSLEIIRRT